MPASLMCDRRSFLRRLLALPLLAAAPRVWSKPRYERNPFTLGVASGYPLADSVALWTRLAPRPFAPDGGLPQAVLPVQWEVAEDAQFKRIAARGEAYAEPAFGHSVHVEVTGLRAARPYFYRFHSGAATSAVGRTTTTPEAGAAVKQLRFAFASCQHYEQGYYGAYRHMVAGAPDLIIHLGDYIYESSRAENRVRAHEGPEPVSLTDYRARYACYRSDPDLQAAHAACPWLLVWDDHEVENDYANAQSENLDQPEWFLARRAAAYQAWYEHMPVRRTMLPYGPYLQLYTRVAYGDLVSFNLLDDRQYRSPQPCPRPGRGGAAVIENCAARDDPAATLLGARQEAWLAAGLAQSKARWNVLAQQTLMAQSDGKVGEGQRFYSDGWDGYPAARARLFDQIVGSKLANPVVIGGDVHAFWVADLKRDFNRPESPTIASEFVGSSITSRPPPQTILEAARAEGPHIKLASGTFRGYVAMTLTPDLLTAELRAVDDHRDPATSVRTVSTWVVEDGKPGPVAA